MAGVRIIGKSKKKTNIFWSTVPENEQFRNVLVPGVDLEVSANNKMNLKRQEPLQSVRKSKSDPGVTSSNVNLLTSRKNAKTVENIAGKRQELQRKNTDALQGDVSNTVSDFSDSSTSRRASIKNLTIEDKKRVANLIKELAKTGEERELALERLQEERVSFDVRLCAIQEEQVSLRFERESLRGELKQGQELLKQYETELETVKRQKEEQALILNKQFVAFAQGTQTSPVMATSPETSRESQAQCDNTPNCRTSHDTKHPPESHLPSEVPQLPVYSNSLFDLKTSKVEQSVKSSGKSVEDVRPLSGGGYSQSGVAEGLGLHELYLREYKLQLHLQEQQLEVQRQQVILQQHLQMLQQLQVQNQNHEPQHGNTEEPQHGNKEEPQHGNKEEPQHGNKEEPQLLQQASLSHTTKHLAHFAEEMNEVPHGGTQGPFVQQQSRRNVVQDVASNHNSQNDHLQNSWSHRSQVINGIPLQNNHSYRDSEYGHGTQPASHNFQKISERNQHHDQLMDHHRAPEPFHHSPEHLGEQYLPAESYVQPTERPYPPVSSTQRTHDMHLAGPEQHGRLLDRKGVQENYYYEEGLHGEFDIQHHYPPESYAHQSRQSYCQPEEHINAMKAKHDLHPTEYHHQQSKQDDFSTEQHLSLTNKYDRSPTERHLNTVHPYTREEYHLPAPNTYYPSEFDDQHHLRQSQYPRRLSSHPTDTTRSMARGQLFYPVTEQHSPQKGSGLYHVPNVPTDHNNNVKQPNSRHRNNNTSDHQSFSSRRFVNAPVPLDQYISNYQDDFTGYNPRVKSNKADSLTTSNRKMDPKGAFDVTGGQVIGVQTDTDQHRRTTTYGNKEQRWNEKQDAPIYSGYSLYKTDIGTPQSPKNPRRSSISTSDVQSESQNYPNSLMEILEDLEVNNEVPSPDVRLLTHTVMVHGDKEENDVLGDVFFLKR